MNSNEELSKKKIEINHKIDIIKRALIEILSMNLEGISLAQLPSYLKKKLPFNLNLTELGFTKLKDLILSMGNQIKIDNRGHNHPFAVLLDNHSYHRISSSTEDCHTFLPHVKSYPMYHHSIDMNGQTPNNIPNDYDLFKYDSNRHPGIAANYYPTFPQFGQPWLNRNASASSFISDSKFNFNKTGTSDSVYVPQAASLYGSGEAQWMYPPYVNISHVRNNTGSDIPYVNNLPLAMNPRPVNHSQDFTFKTITPTKIWLNPNKEGQYDDLIEINSSGFLSEEASMFEAKSRSNSPNHWRTISNLNDPGYSNEIPSFQNMSKNINSIKEERKSEEDKEASNSFQDIEEMIAPILKDSTQQTKPQPVHAKTKPIGSKLIPTSSIFLPNSKRKLEKEPEIFSQNIISASRLKAKTDDINK